MRPNALTRTVISLTTGATVGLTAATVAGAGTSFAASPQAAETAASTQDVSVAAVNNLGLSRAQAKNVQRALKARWGYNDAVDGQLGTNSWKAMQRFLKKKYSYKDSIDGIVGPNTVTALQRYLYYFGYNGYLDGIAGSETRAAFKNMSGSCPDRCLPST
ncbi:peptidoglycan-binding protein [Streptomyces globisporus]|uniref:peptidoglycan-binding domain-containing protein n=1 Tax=Streptomyces globisporus TaxID=1908 RepID=UPI0037FC557E